MSNTPLYKDSTKSIDERVQDLMSQMTLREKVMQIGACWSYSFIGPQGPNPAAFQEHLSEGIGQITRIAGTLNQKPEVATQLGNAIQKYLVENTRLGIPAILHDECLTSFMSLDATVFPQMIGMASSWDADLVEKMGDVIRQQMQCTGARQGLAPVLDVVRDPRWGRTGETFGEDPCLISTLGSAYINGLQQKDMNGVAATAKHFIGYGASEAGMNWAPAHISNREMYEVYAKPFEAAIKHANLASVMPCYNEIDGIPVSISKEMMTDLLRDRLGFNGVVVSDYTAITEVFEYNFVAEDKQEAGILSLKAGMDVELPVNDCYGEFLIEAVEKGLLDEFYVDRALERHLRLKFQLGLFENPYADPSQVRQVFEKTAELNLQKEAALKSMVLLKNDGILPLKKSTEKVAVIGPSADCIRNMYASFDHMGRMEGVVYMMTCNTGNNIVEGIDRAELESRVKMMGLGDMLTSLESDQDDYYAKKHYGHVQTVYTALQSRLENSQVSFAKGCDLNSDDTSKIPEAVDLAANSDVAIVVLGERSGMTHNCTSGEARDRANLEVPGQQMKLLKEVAATGTPVVLVLINERPLNLSWASENVSAILEAWLPGEKGGEAVAELLLGDENPSGKLPITFPRTVGQVPLYYNQTPSGGFSKWFGDYVECSNKPLYAFGYGLSYTQFTFSNLQLSSANIATDGAITIKVNVENTGKVAGDEVVQLYMRNAEVKTIARPEKELCGFKRVHLAAGEKATVEFTFHANQIGYVDENNDFVVSPGKVETMIGSASDDIRVKGEFTVTGDKAIQDGYDFFWSEAKVIN